MDTYANIVLVGFMGTGKTSVGRELAETLGLTFLDMDDVIEERAGKSIPRIFAEDGEPHFRELERNLCRELAAGAGRVIATGGGVVLNADNIRDYSRTSLVVCLWAEPEAILARVAHDTNRPLLAVEDKLGKIVSLLEARRPLYEAIPCRVDTTTMSVEDVVAEVSVLYYPAE